MCLSSPSVPSAPAPQVQAKEQDQAVMSLLEDERRRRAMAAGLASTNKTGGQGVTTPVHSAPKTLLGA